MGRGNKEARKSESAGCRSLIGGRLLTFKIRLGNADMLDDLGWNDDSCK